MWLLWTGLVGGATHDSTHGSLFPLLSPPLSSSPLLSPPLSSSPLPLTLTDTDDLLTRMVIVGIVMSFRRLTLEALHAVLSRRTPFLVAAIERFHENPPTEHPEVSGARGGAVGEVGGAARWSELFLCSSQGHRGPRSSRWCELQCGPLTDQDHVLALR